MSKLKIGDIVLHIFKDKLWAISIVNKECNHSDDAYNRHEYGEYVGAVYHKFDNPILINDKIHYPRSQIYISRLNDENKIKWIIEESIKTYPTDATLLLVKQLLF